MPSPFPGMEPFLENPADWPGVHHLLISAATELLQPQLRLRGYYANIGERVWWAEPRRPIYPNTAIFRKPAPTQTGAQTAAVLDVDEPVHIQRWAIEVRESHIEIYDAKGNHLVTGIEFLSPANKSDATGRDLYRRKQRETAAAGVNLVEVDLLRDGEHVLDVPLALLDELKPWSYLINVARPGQTEFEVYPVRLRERLPRIRIPLKREEPDVVLDLQAALGRGYDTGPYPERLDYSTEPACKMPPDDAAWADALLKQQGLRR